MLGSIHLGTVLGIHVRMHWLFVVLVVGLVWVAAASGQSPFLMLLWLGLLFGLVFLHELGHSLMARRFGIRVLDITFWPLGGMARMSEIPESSRIEGLVALAGPAVNLVLAFLAAPIFFWSQLAVQGGGATPFVSAGVLPISQAFLVTNLLLGVFNLVPAFPMDGGRLLRAWLGRRGDWVRATEQAVRVGRWFALGMVAVGLFFGLRGMNMLPLVGLFVWVSGARELAVVRARHARFANPLAAFGFGPPEFGPEPARAAAPPPRASAAAGGDASGARRPAGPPWAARPPRALSADELEQLEHYPGPLWRAERE